MTLLLSDPITAPTTDEAMADLVYFQQHDSQPWIRVGFTAGKGRREDTQDDFVPVAVLQGTYDDERTLHEYFAPRRVRRRVDISTYDGDEIHSYVAWLLERGHAGRNRIEAESMPRLPFSVWRPESQRNEHRGGQLALSASLPPRHRVAWARSDLAHLSSESDDWYTPLEIIDAAREAMGTIDLDPATSVVAQRAIQATQWYTKAQDGLRTDLPWVGNTWLNPPYGRGESSATAFVHRLVDEYHAGNVTQAITCLNLGSTSALWFAPIWTHATRHLVCRGRPNYWREDRQDSSPTKGTILSYFGRDPDAFTKAFASLGWVIRCDEAVA